MEPITHDEMFMATAAGEYSGELPTPIKRQDYYWIKIIERIENGQITLEEIDAAIEAYLNSHDEDIVTEQELSDALGRKVDKETGKGLTDINYSADEQAKVTASYEAKHTHQNKTVLDGITEAKVQAWDAAEVNVNADWESDNGDSQILNKPDLSGFITRLVNDLAYYYTKAYIDGLETDLKALISAIPKFAIEVVQTLPTTNISATTVYLVPDTNASSSNLYTEYIYVNNNWEPLGTQTVDLSGYVTTEDLNATLTTALATKADLVHTHTKNQITDLVNAVASTNGSGGSAGLMSAEDKEKLDNIEKKAQKNTVTGVKGNSESDYRTGNINITKANIGLENVDNTSDEDKPISTAMQNALDGKADSNHNHDSTYAAKSHTHNYAGSSSAGGAATSAVKLETSAGSATQPCYFANGKPSACTHSLNKTVPSDAEFTDTVYTHPAYTARTGKPAANQTPTFGSTVTISQVTSDVTGHVTGMTDRTIKIPDKTMTGASENAAGAAGLVPPPSAGEQEKFLRGDGKWAALSFLSISTNISSKDFNAYTTSGIWYFGDLDSLGMTNRPVTSTNDAGFLIVFGRGYNFQIFLGAYQSKIYYRGNNGSWQAWKTVG